MTKSYGTCDIARSQSPNSKASKALLIIVSECLSVAQERSEGSRTMKKAQQKLKRMFLESLRVEMPDTPAKRHHEMEDEDSDM